MNYALGAAFNVDELFENFNIKRIKTSYKDLQKIFNSYHKRVACKKIFFNLLLMILRDVIENDITFKLPISKNPCDIHMIKISDKLFVRARQNGKFEDIDFLESNFTGYLLGFHIYRKSGRIISKPIYINLDLKLRLIDKTNSGFTYAG